MDEIIVGMKVLWNKSIRYLFDLLYLGQSSELFKQQRYEDMLQWLTDWIAAQPHSVVVVTLMFILMSTVFCVRRNSLNELYWRKTPITKNFKQLAERRISGEIVKLIKNVLYLQCNVYKAHRKTEWQEEERENNYKIKDERSKEKNQLAPIIATLECIICLDMVKVPFKMCETGHLMCCSCMDILTECPLCQVENFWENLVVIKNLLGSIPHPCRHSGNGCKIVVGPNQKHEVFCPYRPVSCKEGTTNKYCNMNVPLCDLLEHYRTDHEGCVISINNHYIIYNGNLHEGEGLVRNMPFSVFNHFFWLHISRGHETIEMSFKMHPIGEAEKDYFISLKFNKQDQELSLKLKANLDDAIDNTCSSMCVSLKSIEWFFDEKGNLVMRYQIYSKPLSNLKP